jgi:hypothetical protein
VKDAFAFVGVIAVGFLLYTKFAAPTLGPDGQTLMRGAWWDGKQIWP